MGQKCHPIGLRLALSKDWRSRWYAVGREFRKFLHEDLAIREFLHKKLEQAAVPRIDIERAAQRLRITVHTARPGIVIGRKGTEIDKLKEEISRLTSLREVYVEIQEVAQPETNAQLVAENVALQMERRISFRRAMKKAIQTARNLGVEGIKLQCSGRLGGSELARMERYHEGKVPLQTLRADIDYGFAEAQTVYGKIGVKAWIYKGDKRPVLKKAA
ncbi:MAG: 30S ribosomal protein S3 [Verrucomicrobiia bacterium]|jgi:small subunit ribosomal protein S3